MHTMMRSACRDGLPRTMATALAKQRGPQMSFLVSKGVVGSFMVGATYGCDALDAEHEEIGGQVARVGKRVFFP